MNALTRTAGILVVILFSCSGSFAQSTATRKQELLQHMLREKLHRPGKATQDNDKGERTTAASDGRVSTTSTAFDEGEISLAYNPTDSTKMVISYMEVGPSGLNFPIYYSNNGGTTWTKAGFNSVAIFVSDFPGENWMGFGDPAFAWDKNGTLYFGWIYLSKSPTSDTTHFTLNWAYSNDNGHTWSVKPDHFIGQGALDTAGGVLNYKDGMTDREWFAVDNSGGPYQGNLYCSYLCFPPGAAPQFMAVKTKTAGVDTFGPAVHAYNGDAQFGNIEVNKNGVLNMSFYSTGSGVQIRHMKSTDGGATFTPSVLVGAATALEPAPPHIVHNRENGAVNLAVGGASTGNDVHIVWSDFPGTTVNSFYARSTDGGSTWSTPLNLNSLVPGQVTFMPTVAAFGDYVAISYTGIDANDTARYYQLNSTDEGASFGSPMLISSAPCNYHALNAADTSSAILFGDYNRSARTMCQVYAAWEDCRNNIGSKVYFSRTDYCALGVQEISLVNGDVQLLSMFPNPSSDVVTLKLNAIKAQTVTVNIADMTGRIVYSHNYRLQQGIHDISLPLGGLPKEVYVVSVQNNEGIIATKSLVVK